MLRLIKTAAPREVEGAPETEARGRPADAELDDRARAALGGDASARPDSLDTAFHQMRDVESPPDFGRRRLGSLELKRRAAAHDLQAGHFRQHVEQLFADPV